MNPIHSCVEKQFEIVNGASKETLNPPEEFPQGEKLENKPIFSQESTLAAAGCENIIQFEERCGSWSDY
jgi:hypothetical protein